MGALAQVDPVRAREAAVEALEQAREFKREEQRNRRRAKAAMERFHQFKRDLEAMGCKVVIEESKPKPTEPQRRQSESDDHTQEDRRT